MAEPRKMSRWQEMRRRDTDELRDWFASPQGTLIVAVFALICLWVIFTNLVL